MLILCQKLAEIIQMAVPVEFLFDSVFSESV